MNNKIVTEQEIEEMRKAVLERLKFAKSVQANTKGLEKEYMILTLALVGYNTDI